MLNKFAKQVTQIKIAKLAMGFVILLTAQQIALADTDNPADNLDVFEKLFGVTEGKRRNHTKGFCFKATLIPYDKAILEYSNSELFASKSEVVGRLSHKGGNNTASDAKVGLYGMSLSITTQTKHKNLMSMNTEDFFPVSTPEEFMNLLRAKVKGKEAVKAFKANSPELQRYLAHMSRKPKVLTPYEGSTFNSVSSFYLVDENNNKTAVKWSFVPASQQSLNLEPGQDFFYENMQRSLEKGQVVWDMVITIANDGDTINDPSVQWTGEHKKITAAKLQVSSISTEEAGQCDNINYDPMVLSAGIEPSEDPLFLARRHIYAVGFGRRLAEKGNDSPKNR